MSGPLRLSPEVVAPAGASLVLPVSGETEPLVLARGNVFCVANQRGDIAPSGARDLGLFVDDTRHLSYLELFMAGGPPIVLSSEAAGASSSQIDLTLSDHEFGGFLDDPQNFLHVRIKQIVDGGLCEQIALTNHLIRPVTLWLELRLGADFADLFEVRGARRAQRGRILPPLVGGDRIELGYLGLDGRHYRTRVRFEPPPTRIDGQAARFDLELLPGESTLIDVMVEPMRSMVKPIPEPDPPEQPISFAQHRAPLAGARRQFLDGATRIRCTNNTFEAALEHDLEDIDALRLTLDDGATILGAGIPWFSAPFGRDAILTSAELLSVAPDLAAETLRTLAKYQGRVFDAYSEEEPGKILHELRRGEMARAGEIPHGPYYGSIDATPLWLWLFGETFSWRADRALVDELWPNAERALEWIERRLREGDGFVRYERTHAQGLVNQGWKDSRDGVSFPDGEVAAAPIALVEVQGYVVGAYLAMATLCRMRGDERRAVQLNTAAEALRRRIHEAFFVKRTGYYALALDGKGRVVPTLTSNPGHLLFVDGIEHAHVWRVVDGLMSEHMWTGYGVRTLARGQAVFNPLSYHNGSVWPHDNAFIALGAARHGRSDLALLILEGLYDAARHFRRGRLPELFCGLARAEGDFLVHYPVSCSPQAWASGAFFLLLQACLGLVADAPAGLLRVRDPKLPAFVERIDLADLRVGAARVSLHFARHGSRTHCDVLDVSGAPLRVHIEV